MVGKPALIFETGIFMPIYLGSIWRFRTPMWSFNEPTAMLVLNNGSGETAFFMPLRDPFFTTETYVTPDRGSGAHFFDYALCPSATHHHTALRRFFTRT